LFKITSVDINSHHDNNFVYDFKNGFDSWLILLVHTRSIFLVDGEEKIYPPNCLVIYKPNMPIYYKACDDIFSDDWLHFQCTENDISETNLPFGIPVQTSLPEHCHNLFHLLTTENYLDNEYKNHTVSAIINMLINKTVEAYHQIHSQKHSVLTELRKEIYRYPGENWTLSIMANKVFLSESHLQSLYKKAFNVSCINDVINARIQLAKSLLSYTDYTISYISASCGYRSTQHFFRQFNKVVGCSPNTYRQSLRPE